MYKGEKSQLDKKIEKDLNQNEANYSIVNFIKPKNTTKKLNKKISRKNSKSPREKNYFALHIFKLRSHYLFQEKCAHKI